MIQPLDKASQPPLVSSGQPTGAGIQNPNLQSKGCTKETRVEQFVLSVFRRASGRALRHSVLLKCHSHQRESPRLAGNQRASIQQSRVQDRCCRTLLRPAALAVRGEHRESN